MPSVYDAEGALVRETRNLGWILRYADRVKEVRVREGALPGGAVEYVMRAVLDDGRAFESTFASFSMLRGWLHQFERNEPRFPPGTSVIWEYIDENGEVKELTLDNV